MRSRRLVAWSAALATLSAAGTAAHARDAVRTVPVPAASVLSEASTADAAPARPATSTERATLAVLIDRAKVIRLPGNTATVVIGNPAVADIAVQKNGIVVVTGKSYGTTNLIALDGAGNMLAESTVSVAAPTDNILIVQRGFDRQTYSCTPACQPSVILGDSKEYFTENRGQADARNQFSVAR